MTLHILTLAPHVSESTEILKVVRRHCESGDPTRTPISQVKWGCYMKRTGAAVGEKCFVCLKTHLSAWPLVKWPDFVSQIKCNESFRTLVHQTRAVVADSSEGYAGPPEEFLREHTTGYRVEKVMSFLTVAQVEEAMKRKGSTLKAAQLSMSLESIEDVDGKIIQGYFFSEPDEPRRVVVFGSHHTSLKSMLHEQSKTLRPKQADDLAAEYRKDLCATQPKAMWQSKGDGVPALSDLASIISQAELAVKVAAEKAKLTELSAPAAPSADGAEQQQKPPLEATSQEGKVDEDVPVEAFVGGHVPLPSEIAAAKTKKNRRQDERPRQAAKEDQGAAELECCQCSLRGRRLFGGRQRDRCRISSFGWL